MDNRTKIICTIGPVSEQHAMLKKMFRAGMDCVRINSSHGDFAEYKMIYTLVRSISKEVGKEVAIIQDLQGPKMRVGTLPQQGIELTKNAKVILRTGATPTAAIPVQYKKLADDVRPGDKILLDDGLLELKVVSTQPNRGTVMCKVVTPGILKNHKGMNLPGSKISTPAVTQKDKHDLKFALKQGADYIALSFVRSAEDIAVARRLIASHNGHAGIIAKIERPEALKNLKEIVAASDALMVARGDLGIEVPAECVPIYQKKIIAAALAEGKPVIVATQMLQSMIENPRASRAEISDIATSIFEHADAVMLSNETTIGKYPMEATRTLAKTAGATEHELAKHPEVVMHLRGSLHADHDSLARNAGRIAHEIGARWLIALTETGTTARELAQHRPTTPIIAVSSNVATQRKLALVWGVVKTIKKFEDLKAKKLVKAGDIIVVCKTSKKESFVKTMKF